MQNVACEGLYDGFVCFEMGATLGIADGWGRNSEKICTWTYQMK